MEFLLGAGAAGCGGLFLPVRAEGVVFLALLGIAEDFVGLVDLFELLLGGLFVLRGVRVVFPGEPAKGFLDVVSAGIAGHAYRGVVVCELGWHGGSLCRPCSVSFRFFCRSLALRSGREE